MRDFGLQWTTGGSGDVGVERVQSAAHFRVRAPSKGILLAAGNGG